MSPKKLFELYVTPEVLGHLTPAEILLLRHIIKGHLVDEIAALEYRSWHTIKNELNNLERKLDCHDKTKVIIRAEELGYVAIRPIATEK